MKHLLFSVVFFISTFFMACSGNAQTATKVIGKSSTAVIEVIDFYTTHRCKTCLAIEKAAKSELETAFAKEIKAKTIVFKTVNIDEEANVKLAEKFEASGSALFIYNGKTGNAVDLTDFAFMYGLSNEVKFREGFKAEVNKALTAK